MANVGQPPGGPKPSGSRTCSSCGWANASAATACEFCKLPFERKVAAPAAMRKCPHCGAEAVRHPRVKQCPACERGFDEVVNAGTRAAASAERAVKGLDITPRKVIFLVLVAVPVISFFTFMRAQNKVTTADRMRYIKKPLEIYEGENGGYPESLATLERRFGPIPPDYRKDGWGGEIRYTPSKARGPSALLGGGTVLTTDGGDRLYAECELRSAGPNGKPGDEDDVVWSGKASR